MKRLDAANQGLMIYEADKPCSRGHPPRRYTSTGTCVACAGMHSAARQRAIINRGLGWQEVRLRVPASYVPVLEACAERFRTGGLQERSYLEYLIGKALAPAAPAAPAAPVESLIPANFRGTQQ